MFAAIAIGDTAAAERIRTEQVDPLYKWVNRQVDTLAAERRTIAHEHLTAFESLQGWVATATLAVFALGLSLLAAFWSILRALGRRAKHDQAELIRITAETVAERELARTKSELVAMVDIPQVPGPPRRVVRLLAVDDEAATGSMIRRLMRSSGYETVTTTSAEEALDLLRAQAFDIVLSDLGLGIGMDGWGLAACVRQEWQTPLVLATGAVGISADEARSRGVDGLISKPYLPAELLELLGRLAPSDTSKVAA
jgi:CheY-like chemotaxis protein